MCSKQFCVNNDVVSWPLKPDTVFKLIKLL